ncbi:MAG: LytR/AlgR family response regulator transcription factor [Lachnotalea sp.]
MIKIAMCDENEKDIVIIKKFIVEYMNKKSLSHTIWTYKTGDELLESNHYFNVVFLDVVMGEGIDGINVGRKFRSISRKTKIIYTTGFHQYMDLAFNEVHAFAYLEKPITKEKINLQLDDVLHICNEEKQVVTFEVTRIVEDCHIDIMIKEFDVDDIYYFEYVNRRIKIRTVKGDFYFMDQMKNLISKMRGYVFESCHQSYLINLKYVKKLKGYDLYLKNGEKLPISQKKSAEFRKKINKYIQKSI